MKDFVFAAVLFGLCGSCASAQWQQQTIDTKADLRGLCVVSPKVAWVSGTKGTYAKTTDGGKNWSVATVPGADTLDFRDVEAFSDMTAYLLSAGPGDASRIYKTSDGGKSWTMQFKSADPAAFFDAIAFWDEKNGIALGDPVQGQFQLIVTTDGGANWKPLAAKTLPPALPGEGAFAASGTCLVTHGENDVWFATGGAKTARVFHSSDRGQNWQVSETPITAGAESAGIFSIAFRDKSHGMIVGGDYKKPNHTGATAAITSDGGKTWTLLDKRLPYCSAVAWAKDRWVAVGTAGSHVSLDNGATWKLLDRENYNSTGFTAAGEGWAVGPRGRIAKLANGGPGTLPPTFAAIAYGPHPHQLLDIYIPEGEGPFPVLLWYGRLWEAGPTVPPYKRMFQSKVAAIGVRTRVMKDAQADNIEPPISVCLLDARRALQFVRLHAAKWKLDPDRIAVGGSSQGALPALYVACAGERAEVGAADPVERVSTRVSCAGAHRSQPSIDPKRMQEWEPGVVWGAPALGCSFAESLKGREELLPILKKWSPDHLLSKEAPPIYFENNWGLMQPEGVMKMDYLVHSPRWGLGFQRLAKQQGVACYVKYPGHPTEKYEDIWDFLAKQGK